MRWVARRTAATCWASPCERWALRLPHPDPVSVSGVFLRPGRHGPGELSTQVLRAGRRLSFGTARLQQDGQDVLDVHAAFGDLTVQQGPEVALSIPPALPPPERCVALLPAHAAAQTMPGVTVAERFDYRAAQLPGWRRGGPSGDPPAELWLRFRDGRRPTC